MMHLRDPLPTHGPLEDAEAVLVGVPFDATTIAHPLQRYGPTLIRESLRHVNSYVPGTRRHLDVPVHDAGDVEVAPGSFAETDRRTRATLDGLSKRSGGALPVVLGGDHSISLSLARHAEPASIVSLDAHTDLWETYEDVRYTHATWLYHAHDELDPEVVLLGARSWPASMEDRIDELGVHRQLPERLPEPVHLTIDMDVFDPAYAPEVGFQEPEGLTPEEVFGFVDDVVANHELAALDVVEVSTDELGAPTANLAAQTLMRALAAL